MRFGIDERMLLRQVNLFVTKVAEQNAKLSARQAAVDSVADLSANEAEAPAQAADSVATAGAPDVASQTGDASAPLTPDIDTTLQAAVNRGADPYADALEPLERALLRLVLKYGMLDLGEEFGLYDDGGHVKVIDYIRDDLEVDNITFRTHLYDRIFREALNIRDTTWDTDFARHLDAAKARLEDLERDGREEIKRTATTLAEINVAEQRLAESCRQAYSDDLLEFTKHYFEKIFISHPDDEVRRGASDLVVERHQLSKIYYRQGTKIETEIDRLDDLVPRALVALKYYMGRCRFHELTQRIREVQSHPGYDMAQIFALMEQQKKWHDFCTHLATQIGERVYEPLR